VAAWPVCAPPRVLGDYVDNVTIIERDAYTSAQEFRPGVPQARHVHNLLARGLLELEAFFPGFEQRMRARGAVAVETGWDLATMSPIGWSPRYHTGLWQIFASRPLIESTVLELCRCLHKVTILERTEATALRAAGEGQRYCTGVEVLSRDDGRTRTLDADLVVDASGTNSRAAEWLRQLGLELPEDEVVDGHNGYSSRWFSQRPDQTWPADWWWKVMVLRMATPEHPYVIAFLPDRESALAAQLCTR
jgi:2-polyprenyl-6-methoxyphenol hydroxylase-like FAD-dependent oxidoreductase